jgi:hypothetical protein
MILIDQPAAKALDVALKGCWNFLSSSSPHPQGPVQLVPETILDVGDVRMGQEYSP